MGDRYILFENTQTLYLPSDLFWMLNKSKFFSKKIIINENSYSLLDKSYYYETKKINEIEQ